MDNYSKIYDFENLYKAYLKARRGKRKKITVAKFESNALEAICLLSKMLELKTYTQSQYKTFKVYEPKERTVMTNSFKDKVVQHSLCDNILEPIFERSFILDNYASQTGKGTHFGLNRLEKFMRSYYFKRKAKDLDGADGWVLKCDIKKYFYSIDHDVLKQKVRRYIKDENTLWLVDMIIDSTPSPGIPIGNQTSQWFAVMYLSGLDHFIKERLKIKMYGRYMDDFYLIHEDKEYLKYCLLEIKKYLQPLNLELNNKTNIFPLKNGIDFLGFHTYLTDNGKVIRKVRRKSKNNVKRKLKKFRKMLDEDKITLFQVEQSYQSWRGHASKGNTYHLINDMDNFFKNLFKESEQKWQKI